MIVGKFERTRRGRPLAAWLFIGLCLCGMAFAADDPGPSTVEGLTATLGEVDGLQVRYYEAGEGEPLILLHGGRLTVFNSANMWARNIRGLAEHFHVLALDRYGYGMTGAYGDDDFTFEREIEFLHRFIEAMGIESAHIVGNSSGGSVALLYALAHPERVATLTMIGVGPHTPRARTKGLLMREACNNIADAQQSWSCWMQAMTYRSDQAFDQAFFDASEYMKSLPAWKDIEARKVMGTPQGDADYWGPHWARIRADGVPDMPVLVVCGQHDNLDWAAGEARPTMQGCLHLFDTLGANNERVKLVAYNAAGHFPYREQPEQFNSDLADFARYWSGR